MGTPKFKDEDSMLLDDASMTFYVRKRLQMQARKELFALENYRSETAAMPVPNSANANFAALSANVDTIRATSLSRCDDTRVK
mmetsp:Transcript_14464/g.18270  ORF Transcript_14464/g.18270 Transcript_14464/m.18270 type:complete len:83 (+) Transcript_14464:80-328(+)